MALKSSSSNASSNNKARPTSSSYSSSALEASYQRWINKQLEARALEYSQVHKVSVCCASWNVNARELSESCDLSSWLLSKTSPPADIYAIGLQEIVDLNVMNVVINSAASDDKSSYWYNQVYKVLQATGIEYSLLAERHMVGLQLMIFSRLSLKSSISGIRTAHVYTGGYGVTGNKGGITIRFDVFDSPLCFICAHFHANRENVEQRNLDFQTILETTSLLPTATTASGKRPSLSAGSIGASPSRPDAARRESQTNKHYSLNLKSSTSSGPLTIDSHEQIFWFGDLNYRIVEELEVQHVFEIVQSGTWTGLRNKDQLNVEREKGNVFQNFEEGILTFPPTYKYQPGTNVYDQRPDKKIRAPAWCDRILWKSSNKDSIRQLSYQAAPLNISDHKPISAWFECGVRKVVLEKAREVYQELLFAVDKWINASTPKLSLENRMYDFGVVTINQKYTKNIVISNTGTVMAEWKFVPKNDELFVSKSWLKFSPEEGILAPGESSVIKANFYFAPESLIGLPTTTGSMPVEDIVILRVVNGSDFFCIFSAVVEEEGIETARNSIRLHKRNTPPPTVFKVGNGETMVELDSDEEEN